MAALIARATVTHLPGDSRRTDLATFTYSDRPVVSRPGCPVCSVAGQGEPPVPVAPSAPVGARYEQSVAIPPAAFVDSKGHQQHYKPSNLRLQREFRDWPVCPRTPLPPADLERLDLPDGVGARIVLTGNVDKVARKYFSFALRIAVQDCGCSFEVIRLVADALGVPLRARARWDEQRIARALGTDPAREPACIVVDLGGRRAH